MIARAGNRWKVSQTSISLPLTLKSISVVIRSDIFRLSWYGTSGSFALWYWCSRKMHILKWILRAILDHISAPIERCIHEMWHLSSVSILNCALFLLMTIVIIYLDGGPDKENSDISKRLNLNKWQAIRWHNRSCPYFSHKIDFNVLSPT